MSEQKGFKLHLSQQFKWVLWVSTTFPFPHQRLSKDLRKAKRRDAEALKSFVKKDQRKADKEEEEQCGISTTRVFLKLTECDQFQPPNVLPSNRRSFSLFAKKISLIGDMTRFPALCAFYHKISYFGAVLLLTASHIKDKDGSNDDVLVVRKRLSSSNKTNPIAATRPLISQTRPWGLFCVPKY